jgi:hypothetical protein
VTIETGLLQQFVDAPVEALDHAIRLRVARRRQAMLGRQGCTGHVECVFAAGLLVFGSDRLRSLKVKMVLPMVAQIPDHAGAGALNRVP